MCSALDSDLWLQVAMTFSEYFLQQTKQNLLTNPTNTQTVYCISKLSDITLNSISIAYDAFNDLSFFCFFFFHYFILFELLLEIIAFNKIKFDAKRYFNGVVIFVHVFRPKEKQISVRCNWLWLMADGLTCRISFWEMNIFIHFVAILRSENWEYFEKKRKKEETTFAESVFRKPFERNNHKIQQTIH